MPMFHAPAGVNPPRTEGELMVYKLDPPGVGNSDFGLLIVSRRSHDGTPAIFFDFVTKQGSVKDLRRWKITLAARRDDLPTLEAYQAAHPQYPQHVRSISFQLS